MTAETVTAVQSILADVSEEALNRAGRLVDAFCNPYQASTIRDMLGIERLTS